MVVFPEGTRFGMPRKLHAAAASDTFVKNVQSPLSSSVAKNGTGDGERKQLEVDAATKPRVDLVHHLVPKSKGTWLALQTLRKQTKAIYNVSVVYDGCLDENGKRKPAPQIFGECVLNHTDEMMVFFFVHSSCGSSKPRLASKLLR